MVSSVGSGSVLFTPRIGAKYGYDLFWIALLVFIFMWLMIREAARYPVVAGRTLLDGYATLPGPENWAVWVLFGPQLLACIAGVSGIASLVGSAFMVAFPGTQAMYTILILLGSGVLVVTGKYGAVERASRWMAFLMVALAVLSAARVFSHPGALVKGIQPHFPGDADPYFVLPWVGYILAGAIGITWYSYWVATRGYGGPYLGDLREDSAREDKRELHCDSVEERDARLSRWRAITSLAAATGVFTGALVLVSFLILGAELLGGQGSVPRGTDVARDLAGLLSQVWGPAGFWMLIAIVIIALGGTVLANQDGWSRTFADATLLLLGRRQSRGTEDEQPQRRAGKRLAKISKILHVDLTTRLRLKNAYAIVWATGLPLLAFLMVRDPVTLLSIGGIIATAHTPFVVGLTLYLNLSRLPRAHRPGVLTIAGMLCAGLFYGGFAALYFLDLAGIRLLG